MPLIVNVMGFTRERGRDAGRGVRRARRGRRARAQRLLPERQDRADDRRRPARDRARCSTRSGRCTAQAADRQADAELRVARPTVAAAAEAHGADAVSLINTLRGMALHPRRPGEPWLGGGTGGVSGPAVRAIALAQVAEVRARVDAPDRRDGRGTVRPSRRRPAACGRRSGRGRHRVLPGPAGGRADRGRELRASSGPGRFGGRRESIARPRKALQIDGLTVNSPRQRLNLKLRSRRIRRLRALSPAARQM